MLVILSSLNTSIVGQANGFLEMEMEMTGSQTTWASSNYTHSWSAMNNAQWDQIADSVSVATGGAISISVPTWVDSWEIDTVRVM